MYIRSQHGRPQEKLWDAFLLLSTSSTPFSFSRLWFLQKYLLSWGSWYRLTAGMANIRHCVSYYTWQTSWFFPAMNVAFQFISMQNSKQSFLIKHSTQYKICLPFLAWGIITLQKNRLRGKTLESQKSSMTQWTWTITYKITSCKGQRFSPQIIPFEWRGSLCLPT